MRGFLKSFRSRCATKVVALARLEGIPLFGGIVAVIQLELVIVLPRAVAVRFLGNFRAFSLVPVVVPAVGHLGYIEHLGISTVILFGILKEGTEARNDGVKGQVLLCEESRLHGDKSRVFDPLHEESDFRTLVNSFVTMLHQLIDDGMLLFMSNDKLVKVPIAAFAALKRHSSKFVFNLGALSVDGFLAKQLCVEGLVRTSAVLRA
mmetsp:Transcript_20179/g.41900  ORF Transcript_20179/g.41900 Transcript_20179/m.41900 type:complete len:206 (-) Transcript_20179:665-1282(-)